MCVFVHTCVCYQFRQSENCMPYNSLYHTFLSLSRVHKIINHKNGKCEQNVLVWIDEVWNKRPAVWDTVSHRSMPKSPQLMIMWWSHDWYTQCSLGVFGGGVCWWVLFILKTAKIRANLQIRPAVLCKNIKIQRIYLCMHMYTWI